MGNLAKSKLQNNESFRIHRMHHPYTQSHTEQILSSKIQGVKR